MTPARSSRSFDKALLLALLVSVMSACSGNGTDNNGPGAGGNNGANGGATQSGGATQNGGSGASRGGTATTGAGGSGGSLSIGGGAGGSSTAGGSSSTANGGSSTANGGSSTANGGSSTANGGSSTANGGSSSTAKGGSSATGGSSSTATGGSATASGGSNNAGGTKASGGAGGQSSARGGQSNGGQSSGGSQSSGGQSSGGSPSTGGSAGSSGYQPCPQNGNPCIILPFGDSITDGVGSTDGGGYRSQLFKLIVQANQKITFVGSRSGGPDQISGKPFPKNHEGHPGWTIDSGYVTYGDGISTLIPNPAFKTIPNIVLLMIGTNDVNSTKGTDQIAARLETLLDKIIAVAPDSLIVLAVPTPLGYASTPLATYDSKIPGIVQARAAKGQHIVGVDMSKMPTSNLGSDNIHPNDQGYVYMASVWYAALKNLLPQ